MIPPPVDLSALVGRVSAYRIADRSLRTCIERLRARLERGEAPREREVAAFLRDARRYFEGVEREAKAQIKDLDRRLDDLFQQQYNLQAERGVAHRRLQGAAETLELLMRGGEPER